MYLLNTDCIKVIEALPDNCIDMTLTDVPYDVVSRPTHGLRNLDKGVADIMTVDLSEVIKGLHRITRGQIVIFCSAEQLSTIHAYFANQQGTTRKIVWEKTNPSPMNGQHIYLSGIELGVWFKKRGRRVFNAHCKNTVFRYPNGSNKIHPTQKNLDLFMELLRDNTNEGELVIDPFMGSGTTGVACKLLNRAFIGVELDKTYFQLAKERIEQTVGRK